MMRGCPALAETSRLSRSIRCRSPRWVGRPIVVRFASVPVNVESVLRKTIQQVDPTILVRRVRVADDYLREALAPTRFTLALLGAFAGVALFLAVVGLYGSIAYTVSQRTREIGIRIALGASAKTVTSLVVSDGLRLALVGLVLGVATAAAASRTLSSLLYACDRERLGHLRRDRGSDRGRDTCCVVPAGAPRRARRSSRRAPVRLRNDHAHRAAIPRRLRMVGRTRLLRSTASAWRRHAHAMAGPRARGLRGCLRAACTQRDRSRARRALRKRFATQCDWRAGDADWSGACSG